MTTDTLFVDEMLEVKAKSWKVAVGNTIAFLAFSSCEQVTELQYIVPKWLIKKIEAAA